MTQTMTKIFTAVLFLGIWLQSASTQASPQITIKNQALSSVRMYLWYQGADQKAVKKEVKGNQLPKSSEEYPEELERALEQYNLDQ